MCGLFGSGDYAMRLWLDPGKIAARNMVVDESLTAVRESECARWRPVRSAVSHRSRH